MLDSLIESRRATACRSAFGGGAVSLLVHSTLIAGAVFATLHASESRESLRIIARIVLPPTSEPPPRTAGNPGVVIPLLGPVRLTVSPVIPPLIPPPATAPFDPARYNGFEPDSAPVLGPHGLAPGAVRTTVYAPSMVEERPERIAGPEPRYPDMLRQAGIDGEVVIECVIDTLGRVEPGTIRVASSTHVLFEQPAREALAASIFRPARLDGRAVRVRVQLPIAFRMARGGNAGP
jgi:protein TonB